MAVVSSCAVQQTVFPPTYTRLRYGMHIRTFEDGLCGLGERHEQAGSQAPQQQADQVGVHALEQQAGMGGTKT